MDEIDIVSDSDGSDYGVESCEEFHDSDDHTEGRDNSSWSVVHQEPITITIPSCEEHALESFIAEIKCVLTNARRKMLSSERQPLSLTNMLQYVFSESGEFSSFSERLRLGLIRMNAQKYSNLCMC